MLLDGDVRSVLGLLAQGRRGALAAGDGGSARDGGPGPPAGVPRRLVRRGHRPRSRRRGAHPPGPGGALARPGRGGRGVVVELVVVRAGVEGGCGGGVATVEIVVVVHLVRTMPVPPTARLASLGVVKLF